MRTRYYKTSFAQLTRLTPYQDAWGWYGLLVLALVLLPVVFPTFVMTYTTLVLISCIGAIGLNVITGATGLISIGHAGFLAVGAYTTAILTTDYGFDFVPALLCSGLLASAFSLVVGIPSLRLKGLYLAITTLAFSIVVTNLIVEAESITRGSGGMSVKATTVLGLPFGSKESVYYLTLAVAVVTVLGVLNLMRSRVGRAWRAIRDYDTAAIMMGIGLARYKLLAFVVSAFLTGVAGSLLSIHIRYVNIDNFGIMTSIEALAMIIVGGLGSVRGAVLGAIVISLLPDLVRLGMSSYGGALQGVSGAHTQEIKSIVYALLIMIFLRFEPDGLASRWARTKRFWSEWPLSNRSS